MQDRSTRSGGRRRKAAGLVLWTGLAAGILWAQEPADLAPKQDEPPAPIPVSPEPPTATPVAVAETPAPAPTPTYSFLENREAYLERWKASGLVEALALGTSAGGRELFGVQFGAAGPRALAERTTIFLVGGLDGISLSGSEAVLSIVSELLAAPERLPPEVSFVAIPWANPDGLARWRSRGTGGGRNDRAIDDDGDGQVDEDGPDDLDRDGMILEMLLEDPLGPWVRASDPRFLRPAREGEAPRFLRLREGADDDHDGSFNEDGPGGVLLDHNFPVGWEDCKGPESGPWPLSEPDSKALAELLMARRSAVVLVLQGNHGFLAAPGGRTGGVGTLPLPEDAPTYRRLAEVFGSHSGRNQTRTLTLAEAHGEAWPGSLVDWSYAALGALAMELAVWGPEVEVGRRNPVDAQFRSDAAANGAAVAPAAPEISPVEQAWAHWLDDTRGGSGFVDWQPIQLENTPGAWIGGWERETVANPPLDVLPRTLHGLTAFVTDLASNLPRLEIDLRESRREGKVCLIKARVKNNGLLPSGVGPGSHASSVRLRLEITPGVTLRAGQLETTIGHLPGRGTSDEYGWLLIAPEGSVLRLVVESAWSAPVEREVRL